jgi:hypothetical protein
MALPDFFYCFFSPAHTQGIKGTYSRRKKHIPKAAKTHFRDIKAALPGAKRAAPFEGGSFSNCLIPGNLYKE